MNDDVKYWAIGEPPASERDEFGWIATTPEEALQMLRMAARVARSRAERDLHERRLMTAVFDADLMDAKHGPLLKGLVKDGHHGGVVVAIITQAVLREESA